MRVLIAGAGLGGLCLAQGLRRSGIEAVVLERRGRSGEQPATYGIHLNADGMRAAGPGWMFLSTWDAAGSGRYLVWAWAESRKTYPSDPAVMDPTALRDHVAARTAQWAAPLHRLVTTTEPGTMTAIPLRTMPALSPWEPSTVTLLGDAIHNMTPMAGIGANTALRDADELRRGLLGPGPLVTRVGRYESAMREYANAALALSTRNALSAATTKRLPRTAFRTALRAAEAVPMIKRRIFATPPPRR
ncbi:FAD-dependent oxidoreductase [Streptomyces sp. NPDC001089]